VQAHVVERDVVWNPHDVEELLEALTAFDPTRVGSVLKIETALGSRTAEIAFPPPCAVVTSAWQGPTGVMPLTEMNSRQTCGDPLLCKVVTVAPGAVGAAG